MRRKEQKFDISNFFNINIIFNYATIAKCGIKKARVCPAEIVAPLPYPIQDK